ncbi:hypothetical protein HDU98_000616 [Podochytrium sp. JEL0797]|nr:hypothetical protein HDU98_000616 [Podochytrium sp. JEL0797]
MNNLFAQAGNLVNQIDTSLSSAIGTASSGTAVGAPSSVVSGKVQSLVDQACVGHQLNLDAALRVCDLVTEKQNSYPREVAFQVLKYVNCRYDTLAALNSIGMMDSDRMRGPQQKYEQAAMNALGLLDMLVKNCGYPFHLIIASKEFLNELVKRFPEKPNAGNVIQFRILELIQQWNSTLCVTSRYRDDFKNISDMYRLLSYKGYRFPGVSNDSAAVLTAPSSMLKSEDELEEEDRVAQGAKLQELLRLGTPAALEQANDLMKVLSGYDTEKKPDYKSRVESEIDSIEAKASALNNLLENPNPSSKEIDQLLGATKSAQNRIQTMISNGEQEDRIERLLLINDYINTTLENYQRFRTGQSFTKPTLPQQHNGSPSGRSPAESPATGAISLIDFDEIPSDYKVPSVVGGGGAAASVPAGSSSGLGDLKDLDFFGSGSATVSQPVNLMGGMGGFGGLSGLSSTGSGFSPMGLQQQPMQKPSTSPMYGGSPAYGGIPSFGGPMSGMPMGSAGRATGTVSPSQPALMNSVNLLNQSLDLSFAKPSTPVSNTSTVASLVSPMQTMQVSAEPKEVRVFNKNGLQIKFKYSLNPLTHLWNGQAIFMNTTPVQFDNLTFQIAVPKIMQLQLQPISGTVVDALNQSQVTQGMSVVNPTNEPLKMRFRISYEVNGALVEESGDHVFQ